MKNKNSLSLISAIMISLLFISGCTGFGGTGAQDSSENIIKDPSECISITDEAEKIACFTQAATYKKDIDICTENIDIEPLRDGCIMAVAIAKDDEDLCDLMSNMTKETTSQDKMCKAMITLDTKYCDQIKVFGGMGQSMMIGTCYAFIVEKTKDAKICEQLSSEIAKSYCYMAAANVTGDIEYCRMIPKESQRDDCYFNYATSTGKWEYCADITASWDRKDCYTQASIKAKDPDGCMKLAYPDECLLEISELTGNISICAQIGTSTHKKKCYTSTIQKIIDTGKVSGCEKIPEDTTRYGCMIAFAEKERDTKICKNIPATYIEHKECYMTAFTFETSPKACNPFEDDKTIWKVCSNAVAKNAESISTCEKIKHEPSQLLCRAKIQDDPEICYSIYIGKWSATEELDLISDCITEIALSNPSSDSIGLCNSIKISDDIAEKMENMNTLDSGRERLEYNIKKCKEKVISKMLSIDDPEAQALCREEDGEISEDRKSCWINPGHSAVNANCFTQECLGKY
ncbi:hypothetical protein GQ472_02790 [archaeon]|nr:hypothetical protein [archaeon]